MILELHVVLRFMENEGAQVHYSVLEALMFAESYGCRTMIGVIVGSAYSIKIWVSLTAYGYLDLGNITPRLQPPRQGP